MAHVVVIVAGVTGVSAYAFASQTVATFVPGYGLPQTWSPS